MKIWLKSPDPNGRCCACGNSPCSNCCLITGNFNSTVVDVFNGIFWGIKSQGSNTCIMTSKIISFSPTPHIPSNNISRDFETSFISPAFSWNPQVDILENKLFSIFGSIYTETNVIPRTLVSLTGLSAEWNIKYKYSISSSTTGGFSFSSDNSVFEVYDATYCLENISRNFQFSYIDRLNFSTVSGDTFTIDGSALSIYQCSQGMSYNRTLNKWTASASCLWPSFTLVANLVKKPETPESTGWILYNGNIIGTNNQATISKIISNQSGTVLYQQDVTPEPPNFNPIAADAWCSSNTHSPGIMSGQLCLASLDEISRAGSCLWGANFPCCINNGADFSNPTYRTNNGSMQFKFVEGKCFEMSLTPLFQMNLKIQDANGNFIDPVSRMINLTINTGLYIKCNELP